MRAPRSVGLLIGVLLLAGLACSLPSLDRLLARGEATPTAPALESVAPRWVESDPAEGEEILPLDPVTLFFDQPMDRASVEQALDLQPSLSGGYEWLDDRSLQFVPESGWQRGATYVLSVGTAARSEAGLALAEPVRLSVRVAGPLEVTQVLPAPGASEVQPDTVITIVFNRPVVPLQLEGAIPQPLSLEPRAEGIGEWIDTNIYVFRPSVALAGGAAVTARIDETLTDLTGAALAEPFSWSFSTALPRVVETTPAGEATMVAIDAPVVVRFDQPMDPGSVQQAFRLLAPGSRPMDGQYSWDEDNRQVTFRPGEPFVYGTEYEITLGDQAHSAGGAGLLSTYRSGFRVVARPAVATTDPVDGAEVSPYSSIQLTFTAPMDPAAVLRALRLTPAVENLGISWEPDQRTAHIYGDVQASTRYTLTVAATASDPFGTPLAAQFSLSFTTQALPAQVGFSRYSSALSLTPDRPPVVEVLARNLSRLDLWLYRIEPSMFFSLLRSGAHLSDPARPAGGLVRQWSESVSEAPNTMETIGIILQTNPLTSGVYLLVLDSPDDQDPAQGRLLVVRRVELVVKDSTRGSLVWAVDLRSGLPLPGLPLRLLNEQGVELAAGATDADGVWLAAHAPPSGDNPWAGVYAISGSTGDEDFGLTTTAWSYGVAPYDFNVPFDPSAATLTAYLYTDRPIYRPGQTVYYRGVVRAPTDSGYALPDMASIPVTVHSSSGEAITDERASLSSYGTFDGQVALGEVAPLGTYWIETEFGSVVFEVAEYRRPEFLVEVEAQAPEIAVGDRLSATIRAVYTFGGPVADAEVSWVAWSQPTSLPDLPLAVDWFAFSEFGADPFQSETIAEGQGRTGPDGTLLVSLPTSGGDGRPRRVTLEATLTDAAGLPVSARTEVTMHPAAYYLSVTTDEYVVRAGDEAGVMVRSLDWEADSLPGIEADVRVERLTWHQTVAADGSIVWVSEGELLNRASVTTEADGVARVSFRPPTAGTYRVQASGRDPAGRSVSGSLIVYASGVGEAVWRQPGAGRMALVPDRATYRPGETARILVPSPFDAPAAALLTVERDGVVTHSVHQLSPSQSILEVPIQAGYAPNVFVSVVVIDAGPAAGLPGIAVGLVELPVDASDYRLQVDLTPDRSSAGPGEEVTYTLRVRDSSGQPVEAELSLALVDVATLALLPPNSPLPFEALYAPRPLRVQTGASLTVSGEGAPPAPTGGGLGGGGEGAATEVRTEFPDTAFWRADVVTDRLGQARVTLTLPDSLTTWHMDARAVTRDTRVGSATLDVVATKDLLIRPVTPRFFTAGDSAVVAAIVHNNTSQSVSAEVWLEADGAQVIEPSRWTVDLPANSQTRVDWSLSVADQASARLVFHVAGGGMQDASTPTIGTATGGALPVLRYSAPDTAASAGLLTEAGRRLELVSLPRRIDATQGDLRLTLDPSLGSAVVSALEALETRPSSSNELSASRLLADLGALQVLEATGIQEPQLRTRLAGAIPAAIDLLSARQLADGGWGWWPESPSQPSLTAAVLYALGEAEAAGFPVRPAILDAAADRLRAGLLPADRLLTGDDVDRQAMALSALAAAGRGDPGSTRDLARLTGRLSNGAAALIVRTLARLDPLDESIARLTAELNAAAVVSATGAHWEDPGGDRSSMPSAVRTTAQAVQAFLATDPANPLLPGAVRWLLATRRPEGDWPSSHESGWATLAVSEWIVQTGVGDAAYDYTVDLNGLPWATGQAVPGQLAAATVYTEPVASLVRDLPNQLALERGPGPGALAYTAHLTVFRPVEEVAPIERGLSVSREVFRYDGVCGGLDDPCPPADSVAVGDELLVRVTLRVPAQQYYVVVEDPYPAGAEPIDRTLETSPSRAPAQAWSLNDPLHGAWGWWWFTRAEVGDDHLTLYADVLPAGTYQYTYRQHAAFAGEYRLLPTRAYDAYFPEVYAHAAGRLFTILAGP